MGGGVIISVTRFGKFSHFGTMFKVLGQNFEGLVFAKLWILLSKNALILGKFSLLEIAKYFKII